MYMTDFDTTAQDGNLDLISLAQSGDRDALEQLITQNMGLVKNIARRFVGRGTEALTAATARYFQRTPYR